MARSSTQTLALRRKREGRTDYVTRLKLLGGTSPRLVFRKSLNHIYLQVVSFTPPGDKTLCAVSSRHLAAFGWKGHRGNLPSAYLTGYLCGLTAKKAGITKAVLDLGLQRAVPKSSAFAAVKGARDAGLDVPCSADVLPSEEQVTGVTITTYAKDIKNHASSHQFKRVVKSGVSDLTHHVREVKKTIEQQWQNPTKSNK